MKPYYYISFKSESGEYFLSKQYEEAAELVLGYGGVWTKERKDARLFRTLTDAKHELNKMQRFGCGKTAEIKVQVI